MAIINSQGVRSTIFTPDVAFTSVVKKHIAETRSCCNRMVELVANEIFKIIEKVLGDKVQISSKSSSKPTPAFFKKF